MILLYTLHRQILKYRFFTGLKYQVVKNKSGIFDSFYKIYFFYKPFYKIYPFNYSIHDRFGNTILR